MIAAPAKAAISIASASESVPFAPRKETVTAREFSAMKMTNSTSITTANPIATQTRPASVGLGAGLGVDRTAELSTSPG